MTNIAYKMAEYQVTIELPKTVEDVFLFITTRVSAFWPEEFEGKSASPGDEFVLKTGDSHYSKNKVLEVEKNKKVVWLVTESIRKADGFQWTGTKMQFDLTPKQDHTLLQFTYDGIIPENEYERLREVCDMVIEKSLYHSIMSEPVQQALGSAGLITKGK